MVEREDAVLVAIPLFVVGGVATARLVRILEPTLLSGNQLAAVPFTTLGLLAALAVIGHELLVRPRTHEGY